MSLFQPLPMRFSYLTCLEAAQKKLLLFLEARLDAKGVSWLTLVAVPLMVPAAVVREDQFEEH